MTTWRLALRAGLPPSDRDLALTEVSHLLEGVQLGLDGTVDARALRVPLAEAVRRLAFVQTLSGPRPTGLAPAPWWTPRGSGLIAVPELAAAELLTLGATEPIDLGTLVEELAAPEPAPMLRRALARKTTSTPHAHGLHKYKARFFPRMVRAQLHVALDRVPAAGERERRVLDPFVGSGTTTLECARLGVPSVGVDIDPLSIRIARGKRALTRVEPAALAAAAERLLATPAVSTATYTFPPWMARKWERKQLHAELRELERQVSRWQQGLAAETDPALRLVLSACLSDALVRKFNVRMMGTGVGRFALEVRQRAIGTLLQGACRRAVQAARVLAVIDAGYRPPPATHELLRGTATALDVPDASVSLVFTSPPYLPASSGREDYLVGKSIPLTALGLMSAAEIAGAETASVGSMKAAAGSEDVPLPAAVHALVDWLQSDELRRIKAAPTLRYHRDLLRSLREVHRVLVPGGEAMFVIGKASVFYRFKTREVLYRVACDDIFRELAEQAGFAVIDQVDVKLDKKNRNARPRSLDDYYESVITLRRTA